MSVKYQDPQYANDRLAGCVVSWGGHPVYIDHINGEGQAILYRLGTNKHISVNYEELDLTPVSLGNANIGNGVSYVSRIPKRRDWRQGLRDNNMQSIRVSGSAVRVRPTDGNLVRTMLKLFPSLNTCVESIECGEKVGMAFSKYFSVSTKDAVGYLLHYKLETVGHVCVGADGTLNPKRS